MSLHVCSSHVFAKLHFSHVVLCLSSARTLRLTEVNLCFIRRKHIYAIYDALPELYIMRWALAPSFAFSDYVSARVLSCVHMCVYAHACLAPTLVYIMTRLEFIHVLSSVRRADCHCARHLVKVDSQGGTHTCIHKPVRLATQLKFDPYHLKISERCAHSVQQVVVGTRLESAR